MTITIKEKVKNFYEEQPFNYYGSLTDAAAHIKNNPIRAYPDLHQILSSRKTKSVVEFGCGTGWFTNALAYHYANSITAVDLTPAAIKRAQEIAEILGVSRDITFVESDLFDFSSANPVDLVASIGVLHHTHNARQAFEHIQQFVKRKGFVFLGLYHLYGRKVFLKYFKDICDKEGEEVAFQRFKSLDFSYKNETFLRSQFRDQVLHPHETLHTLEEVLEWLQENGFILRSTSINRFEKIKNTKDMIELEKEYEKISFQKTHVENCFFPGFFTIMAQKM
jgi:cyclopropane fatty-acyl-phospholipid synthase-like methyltransferase